MTLSVREYKLFIDGKWCGAADGRTLTRISPAHDLPVTRYAQAGRAETRRAIDAARRAFDHGPWPRMTGGERASFLLKIADLITRDAGELARLDVLESGKPITQARGEIAGAADIWRYAASLARTLYGDSYNTLGEHRLGLVLRDPIGVVSLITPWNFPFLIVSQKLPFALAAGCTCLVKPSEMTSASTLHLGHFLREAGVPDGVVNIIAGTGAEVGARLASDPRVDMVSFTGSTRSGTAIMTAAATGLKKVTMELGGKNPQIVFADADLDSALEAVVRGAYFNAGECCNAGSRLLLERSIAEAFLARVASESQRVIVGDPLAPSTQMGAIISPEHLSRIEAHIATAAAAGARIILGGGRIADGVGQFMAPTIVVDVQPSMAIATEEVFGPVLAVSLFDHPEEALALANAGDYGLSAAVWSSNTKTALTMARRLRAGTVWVNAFLDGAPELPFGGVRKSGIGRELGRMAVEDYTETKTLNIHLGPGNARWIPQDRPPDKG